MATRGYIYEVSEFEKGLGGISEEMFYDIAGRDFDYVKNAEPEETEEQLDRFFLRLGKIAATGTCPGRYFMIRETGKTDYFREAYERLREEVGNISLEDFSEDRIAVSALRNLIDDHTEDAVYYNGVFMTVDRFIRVAKTGARYYVGPRIVKMH